MNNKKFLQCMVILVLIVSVLACGGTPLPVPPVTTPVSLTATPIPALASVRPAGGTWKGKPTLGKDSRGTGYANIGVTLNSEGTAITAIDYSFANWECDEIKSSAGQYTKLNEKIVDDKFEFTALHFAIEGTFEENGVQVQGTWEFLSSGKRCSGSWQAYYSTNKFEPVSIDLEDTTWGTIISNGCFEVYHFQKNGVLDIPPSPYCSFPAGVQHTWRQDDTAVHFEVNNGFSKGDGIIYSDGTTYQITGKAQVTAGGGYDFILYKLEQP